MVQGDSGGWSAVPHSLPIHRRRGRRARKVREYSMQMPAESFFLAVRGTTACCASSLSLSLSLSPRSLLPRSFLSFPARCASAATTRTYIHTVREGPYTDRARYARSRRRPCGRTPALPAYLHARYKPLSTGRLSNLDLSSSSIYTCAHYSLSLSLSLSHTHTRTHARAHTHTHTHTLDSLVIICTMPRVSPRAARLCIFSVGRNKYASTTPRRCRALASRGDSGICCTGMDAAVVGRSTETRLPTCRLDAVSCYTLYGVLWNWERYFASSSMPSSFGICVRDVLGSNTFYKYLL